MIQREWKDAVLRRFPVGKDAYGQPYTGTPTDIPVHIVIHEKAYEVTEDIRFTAQSSIVMCDTEATLKDTLIYGQKSFRIKKILKPARYWVLEAEEIK